MPYEVRTAGARFKVAISIGSYNWNGTHPRQGKGRRLKSVLFVCTANICRSPMAAAIFDTVAASNGLSFRAQSAGVAALEGEPMTPNAATVLEEIGIHPPEHRARQVSASALEDADLVLTMSPQQLSAIKRQYGDKSGAKLHTLPDFATGVPSTEGIPDPYGHTITAYRASMRQILEYVKRVAQRLETH